VYKQLLVPAVALAAIIISASGLSAQSAPRLIATCSSGLPGGGPKCPLDRRLLIDVRRHGEGAPWELYEVVHLGASAGNNGGFDALRDSRCYPRHIWTIQN
jgi:hypothetical protein